MIPQIQEVNFPAYATLHQAVVSLSEMGDRVITTQVRIDGDVVPDFDGWELRFKGERFILPIKEPQAAKDNTTRNSLVDLTFYSWAIYEMKRFFFVEMTSTSSGTAIADKYVAPLALNIESFVDAFNNVLNYYFGNKIRMDLFQKGQGIYSTDPAMVDIDYTYIWDVLTKVYETYDVRWVLEYDSTNDIHVIKVGYPAAAIEDHDFEYGYQGGLVRFERQVQEENVTNVLLGRGGENNLPYRYFKRTDAENPEWAADPDAIPELQNIYFDRLRDINFRRYVQGWKTNPNRDLTSWDGLVVETYDAERGEEDFAYAKGHTDERFNPVEYVKDDYSILKYGEHWGALDDNDEIYPTIQGVDRDGIGRVDEVVDVSEILTDDIQAAAVNAATEYDVLGVKTTLTCEPSSTYEIDIRGEYFDVPEGKTANFDKVGAWVESFSTGKVNGTTVFSNTKTKNVPEDDAVRALIRVDSGEVRVFDRSTGERVASNVGLLPGYYYYELHLIIKSDFTSSVFPDAWASVNFTVGTTGMRLTMSDQDSNAWKPTFDIWVKNIWDTTQGSNETDDQYSERVWRPILGDHFGKEASIAFSDGFMSISEDYDFIIASYPVPDRSKTRNGVTSEWKITLYKSDAEFDVTGFYIPNSQSGGQPIAGDHFYFLGIDMPHFYVKWAEERLNGYKQESLDGMAEISPTWIIQLDKVRVHTLEQEEYGATLAERLATGATIRTKDKRFTNNAVLVLYVQSITYTWNEPSEGNPYLVPDIEVVLSDKPAATEGTIDRMQSDISVIRSTYARTADLEYAIRKTAGAMFLKKTGESDSSASPTTFSSKVSSTNFRQGDISGQGWGFYLDNVPPPSEPPAQQSRALRAPAPTSAETPVTENQKDGNSVLELDKLIVRKELRVNTLIANQISYIGGKQINSAAAIECSKVVDTEDGYVCYFDQKQGSVANLFVLNDIAYGQVFDPKNSEERYYKRLVVGVGDDYIVLSKTEYDGEGIPQDGDTIIQFGNTEDTSRQYVIVRDVIGGGYERMLSNLNSLQSSGKEYYFAGMTNQEYYDEVELQDSQSNTLFDSLGRTLVYREYLPTHRWFVGDKEREYAEWMNGALTVKGTIIVKNTNGTYTDMSDYADTVDYLRNALPKDDLSQVTTITGGIVLSTIIGVQSNGNLVAGLNASTLGEDEDHGILMIFAGSSNASSVAYSKFRVYQDGHVVASDIEATGGTIGGFRITGSYIGISQSDSVSEGMSLYDSFISFRGRNTDSGMSFAALGSNTMGAPSSWTALARIEASGSEGLFNGAGLYINVQDFANNYSIYCANGLFAGLRPNTRIVTNSETLTNYDHTLIVDTSTETAITLTLPSDPKQGQTYFVIIPLLRLAIGIVGTYKQVTIDGNGKDIVKSDSRTAVSSHTHTQFRGIDILVYYGNSWYMTPLEPLS